MNYTKIILATLLSLEFICTAQRIQTMRSSDEISSLSKRGIKGAVIEFGAPWCGFCKKALPLMEKLSSQYPHISFFYVDTNDQACSALASQYNIRSLPTFVFIYNDNERERIIGFNPDEIKAKVHSFSLLAR